MTADERTALIAAGWQAALCPELPGAWWRHPSRGQFVYSTEQALASAAGQPVGSFGLCECGCGHRTRTAPQTSQRLGWVKGRPLRFINGHQTRRRTGPVPSGQAAA